MIFGRRLVPTHVRTRLLAALLPDDEASGIRYMASLFYVYPNPPYGSYSTYDRLIAVEWNSEFTFLKCIFLDGQFIYSNRYRRDVRASNGKMSFIQSDVAGGAKKIVTYDLEAGGIGAQQSSVFVDFGVTDTVLVQDTAFEFLSYSSADYLLRPSGAALDAWSKTTGAHTSIPPTVVGDGSGGVVFLGDDEAGSVWASGKCQRGTGTYTTGGSGTDRWFDVGAWPPATVNTDSGLFRFSSDIAEIPLPPLRAFKNFGVEGVVKSHVVSFTRFAGHPSSPAALMRVVTTEIAATEIIDEFEDDAKKWRRLNVRRNIITENFVVLINQSSVSSRGLRSKTEIDDTREFTQYYTSKESGILEKVFHDLPGTGNPPSTTTSNVADFYWLEQGVPFKNGVLHFRQDGSSYVLDRRNSVGELISSNAMPATYGSAASQFLRYFELDGENGVIAFRGSDTIWRRTTDFGATWSVMDFYDYVKINQTYLDYLIENNLFDQFRQENKLILYKDSYYLYQRNTEMHKIYKVSA